jgi:predicted nuclease with TOPRIM domain
VTARGENAVPSGRPGNGGAGGTLRSTLNLGALADLAGGNAGAQGSFHVGGILSARRCEYVSTVTIVKNGQEITNTDEEDAPKTPGNNAAAPSGQGGTNGTFALQTDPGAWMHSFSVRSIVQYAKDTYLNDRITETRGLLAEYRDLLRAHDRIVGPDEQLSDEDFSEKVNRDQLQTEVGNLLYRIDSNLDYFGNPAGWVPMLSFEANFLAFQNEVDQSLPILYLTYWLNNAATNLQASLAATQQAKSGLDAERARMETSYNDAQTALPRLKSEAASIAFQIGAMQGQITNKLSQLEKRANDNVADRHNLPFWKKALGVMSVVADLVPVGQPTVGRIGQGLKLLEQIDPDKPIESAKALQPQAFSVMTNIDISVCLTSSAPPSGSSNEVKKSRQDQLKRLTDCGKFLADEFKEVSGVFKDAQVDDKEVAAELEKLKASDTELQDLVKQLVDLNAQKERYANELSATLQLIGGFTSGLAQNLVATHELEDRIAASINILDHGALMHIKEMERRTNDRLVQYQYLLAKSFEYRQLRPYPGTLQLTRLFARFRQLIEANTSHLLTQQEFLNLKGIFVEELREVVAQSLDNVNAPSRSFPKSYRLSTNQLAELNQKGRLVLGLKNLGLIDGGDENVRLADLRTRTLTARPVGPVGSLALVRVNFEHLGVSRLTSGGRTFLFRHYQTEAVNPIVWNTIFDANTGQTVNSVLSAAAQSLISVLLAQQPIAVTNLVYFSQPAADAEILLTKDVSTDNGTDFVIDDLLFEIQYDFTQTSGNLRELNVQVSNDLTPVIVVSQHDINNRQDGIGDFNRVFPPSTQVTLQAPAAYGQFVFDRWFLNNQPQPTHGAAVSVFLSGDTKAEARYRLTLGPPVLTLINTQTGQIGLSFRSEPDANYTLEQSPRLINPAWTPVATRVGDGTTLQFTLPIGGAPATFLRVRQGL